MVYKRDSKEFSGPKFFLVLINPEQNVAKDDWYHYQWHMPVLKKCEKPEKLPRYNTSLLC
jgi:hypothetical protein